jgi:hypothetical protein
MKMILMALGMFASSVLVAQTVIPDGTVIPVMLHSSIDAKSSKQGQPLKAEVMQDVPLQGGNRLKSGTKVFGDLVSVTPASASTPATIVFRFSQIESNGQSIPILASLRALASPWEVSSAQIQYGSDRRSNPTWAQTTTLIGGDVAYRDEGKVFRGKDQVGVSVYAGGWGTLSRLSADLDNHCQGPVDDNDSPQALWLFSHDACGVYGYQAIVTEQGRTSEGRIAIASTAGGLKILRRSGLLLRVITKPGDEPAGKK